jgi:hypothetical protein
MMARVTLTLAALAVLALAGPAIASADRVASATGVTEVNGQPAFVDVVVAVPPGKSDRAATDDALRQQGARPVGGGGQQSYAFSGLRWDVLPVVQSYNSTAEPLSASSALQDTEATWSHVQGSSYAINYGGSTSRCPSLVQQCPGPQAFDSHNDVGWQRLGGSTLGVTWYSTSIDEADMALNYKFAWSSGCTNVSGRYDVESVFLHENGHVAGLDHTNDPSTVMYPSYQGARCALGAGDAAGIAALY